MVNRVENTPLSNVNKNEEISTIEQIAQSNNFDVENIDRMIAKTKCKSNSS